MIEHGNLHRMLAMHLNLYRNFIVVTLTNQVQVLALRLVELVVKGADSVMMVLQKHHIEIRTFNLLAEVHMVLSQNAMMKIQTYDLPTRVSSLNH